MFSTLTPSAKIDMETHDGLPEWIKPKRNKHICLPPGLLEELRGDPDLGLAQSMVHTLDDIELGTRAAT